MLTIIFGIVTLLIFGVACFSIRKEPRRLINGVLLQAGFIMIYVTTLQYAMMNGRTLGIERGITIALYVVILLLGIALLADFVLVIKREGVSIAHLLPFFFGILSIIVAIVGYNDVTRGISGSKNFVIIMSILQNIILLIPFAIGSVLIYSIVYLLLPKNENADYIVILGCGLRKNGEVTPLLRGRLDWAIKAYHKSGDKSKFVTSGGQGSDEIISESQAMKNYLLSQGIHEDKIIMEDKSVNTRQNLLFSKKKIKEDGCGDKVLICTSNYHVLRAVILARSLNFNAQGIGGHTAFYYLPLAFIREYIAMIFKYKLSIVIYIVLAVATGMIF